ncbi:MAG: ATP-binding protein [Acidobacteriota bacterium]|nr:ATP-binding protein [Acidobacteriota bacterium]
MTDRKRIRPRVRDAVIQSLKAGVVPRSGLQHVQVGRKREVEALVADLDRIADGGAAIRLIIGEYGSGKTFFLQLVRSIALEKKLVAAHVDLNPDRRLHATGGQARSLYRELMRNLSTRGKPDGGALPSVVERFVSTALKESRGRGVSAETVIHERLDKLSEQVGGYDFAEVIAAYWRGHDTGDETLKSHAIRWLRAEFSTRTDARRALGVRSIVDDAHVYDYLKLFSAFVRLAGMSGFLVCLDEVVNLYKLASGRARRSNYEQILRILNDTLQGSSEGLGFLLGGTPEFLLDPRKGLYSYEALETRLSRNTFAVDGLVDFTGPVLQLENLSPEDLYVLLTKIRHVFAAGDPQSFLLPDEGLHAFMEHCSKRIGEAYFRTPRNTVTAFVNLLAVLEQNPEANWRELLGRVDLSADPGPSESDEEPATDPTAVGRLTGGKKESDDSQDETGDDDELASFRL